MSNRYKFCGDLVNIADKRYTDNDINKNDLSMLLGIDNNIISRYDNWFLLDGEFYYFKYSFIFEEILMSEFCKEFGIRCVDYFPVRRNMTNGIISKLYRKRNMDYYMYSEFCNRYFNQGISNLNNLFNMLLLRFDFEDVCNLMNDIYGMIVMDLFSGQTDRLEYNFFFECGDTVRLAPLCDNGRCFGGDMMYRSPFGNFSLYGSMNNSYNDIYNVLNENKDFYFKLSSLLDIDMNDILKRTIDKYNIVINSEYKSYLLGYFDKKKNDIEKVLRRCKK